MTSHGSRRGKVPLKQARRAQSEVNDDEEEMEDAGEVNERIAEFMRDFVQRKVNVANSFTARGARILEQLPQVVRTEPLKYVGTMLDASARIYAMRVDNTYGECYTVRSHIEEAQLKQQRKRKQRQQQEQQVDGENALNNQEKGADALEDDDEDDEEEGPTDADEEGGGTDNRATTSATAAATAGPKNWAAKRQQQFGRSFIATTPAELARINRPAEAYSTMDDPIYAKVMRAVGEGEGTMRGFISNEVPTSADGKWLLLHRQVEKKKKGNGSTESSPPSTEEGLEHVEEINWEDELVRINQLRDTLVNRVLGPEPTDLPLLDELCRVEEPLHLRDATNEGEMNAEGSLHQLAKRQRKDVEERAQSVLSTDECASSQAGTAVGHDEGGLVEEGNGTNGKRGLYLLTRFAPLVDSIWHAELKVAASSELQRLGLTQRLHHHHHRRLERGKSREPSIAKSKTPFKVPFLHGTRAISSTKSASSRMATPGPPTSPRKRNHPNCLDDGVAEQGRLPSTQRSRYASSQSRGTTVDPNDTNDTASEVGQREQMVVFWSRPRKYPVLYPGQVIKENPMENDPLVSAQDQRKAMQLCSSASQYTSRAASQAPPAAGQSSTDGEEMLIEEDGASNAEPSLAGTIDALPEASQLLSATMTYLEDGEDEEETQEDGASTSAILKGSSRKEKEQALKSGSHNTPREDSVLADALLDDGILDDHWLGDPNRATTSLGPIPSLTGLRPLSEMRAEEENQPNGNGKKGEKPKRRRGKNEKESVVPVQKPQVEMATVWSSSTTRDSGPADALAGLSSPQLLAEEVASLSVDEGSCNRHVLDEDRLVARNPSLRGTQSSGTVLQHQPTSSFDAMGLVQSSLYYSSDETGFWVQRPGGSPIHVHSGEGSSKGNSGPTAGLENLCRVLQPGNKAMERGHLDFEKDEPESDVNRVVPDEGALPPPDGPLNFDDDFDEEDGGGEPLQREDQEEEDEADGELRLHGGGVNVRQARIRPPLVKRAIAHILSTQELDSYALDELLTEYANLFPADGNAEEENADGGDNLSSSSSSEGEDQTSDEEEEEEEMAGGDSPGRTTSTPGPSTSKEGPRSSVGGVLKKKGVEVQLSGEHTFRSLLVHLPEHLHGGTRRDLNVQNAFSIALHMGNECGLRMVQERNPHDGTVTEAGMQNFRFCRKEDVGAEADDGGAGGGATRRQKRGTALKAPKKLQQHLMDTPVKLNTTTATNDGMVTLRRKQMLRGGEKKVASSRRARLEEEDEAGLE